MLLRQQKGSTSGRRPWVDPLQELPGAPESEKMRKKSEKPIKPLKRARQDDEAYRRFRHD